MGGGDGVKWEEKQTERQTFAPFSNPAWFGKWEPLMLTCTYDFYCCKQEPPLKLPGNRSQPGQFTTTESRLKDKA